MVAESPVSHVLRVSHLPRSGITVAIDADDESRAVLAAEHGLVSVERFHAELTAYPWKAGGVRVSGRIEADVTQECVVTLEPLATRIDEPVSATFVPEDSPLARDEAEGGEILVEAESEDVPEPFGGDRLDLGALAEEFFTLGIDPYPRKAGVALDLADAGGDEGEKAGPLQEGLRKLRQRD